jgi:hypothetical protein
MRITFLLWCFGCLITSVRGFPPPQTILDARHPFIFYHQRKAGGSTLRSLIHKASVSIGVPSHEVLIPCKTHKCTMWSWDHKALNLSVVAGHFSVASVWHTYKWGQTDRSNVRCLTNMRDPLERTVSCLFYRFPNLRHEVERGLTPGRLEVFLQNYSSYGFGCNNEAIRMMSGFAVEEVINSLAFYPDPAFVSQLVNRTVTELTRCSIVMLKPPLSFLRGTDANIATTAVLLHWFPWMAKHIKEKSVPRSSRQQNGLMTYSYPFGHELRRNYTAFEDERFTRLILRYNNPDVLVYRKALDIYKKQLQYLGVL